MMKMILGRLARPGAGKARLKMGTDREAIPADLKKSLRLMKLFLAYNMGLRDRSIPISPRGGAAVNLTPQSISKGDGPPAS